MKKAVVVGSGPNGLAAAITLAQAGVPVTVFEAAETVGGGARSAELTLPGFIHDVCSAIHPMAIASPFFRSLPLADRGFRWIQPPVPVAHPLDDGTAVLLERSLPQTALGLGQDGPAYYKLMRSLVEGASELIAQFLAPIHMVSHPLLVAKFGIQALRSASGLARGTFQGERARALFGGLAGHAIMPPDALMTASFGLMLGALGHALGWPLAQGGSQQLSNALAGYLQSLGGRIVTSTRIENIDDLPSDADVFFDTTPSQLLNIAAHRLYPSTRKKLSNFRYGPGTFKIDYALDAPLPWRAHECLRAGTVHLGGTLDEMERYEDSIDAGQPQGLPFLLLAQQSLFDNSRAPRGKHTAWVYCHVPNGSNVDMTGAMEAQIERFAPGFRDRVLARHVMSPEAFETYNANYIGGDIGGGSNHWTQLITRPYLKLNPYKMAEKIYLCSASTPPGAAVHGTCGYFAAKTALVK